MLVSDQSLNIKPQCSISIFIKHFEECFTHDVIFILHQELLLGDLSTWILLEEAVEGDHSVDVGQPVLLDEELHSVQLNEY